MPAGKPTLTLTDVVRAAPQGFIRDAPFSSNDKDVLIKIGNCGTGEFGYYVLRCPKCRGEAYTPRGCRNRHCPSCKPALAQEWMEARLKELLPTHYYQLVVALPPQLRDLALENRAKIYGLFMRTIREVLLEFAANPDHLGAEPALLLVLHTWNKLMGYHVHAHALITAGGYDEANDTWVPAKNEDFFASVHALGKVIRGRFMDGLKKLRRQGKLTFQSTANKPLLDLEAWQKLLDVLYAESWNVFAERPKGGPEHVIRYLGQYIQRAAISNYRFMALDKNNVTFKSWQQDKLAPRDKFGRVATKPKSRTMPTGEFLRLFTCHILPRGFHRARKAGLLAPSRKEALKKAQEAAARQVGAPPLPPPTPEPVPRPTSCPHCKVGFLEVSHLQIASPDRIAFLNRAPTPPLNRATGPPLLLRPPL